MWLVFLFLKMVCIVVAIILSVAFLLLGFAAVSVFLKLKYGKNAKGPEISGVDSSKTNSSRVLSQCELLTEYHKVRVVRRLVLKLCSRYSLISELNLSGDCVDPSANLDNSFRNSSVTCQTQLLFEECDVLNCLLWQLSKVQNDSHPISVPTTEEFSALLLKTYREVISSPMGSSWQACMPQGRTILKSWVRTLEANASKFSSQRVGQFNISTTELDRLFARGGAELN